MPIIGGVKVILTIVVYLSLVLALAAISAFTRRPEPNDAPDEDF